MFNLYTVVQKYIVKLLGPFGFQESGSLYFEHTNFSTIFHFFILVANFHQHSAIIFIYKKNYEKVL